MWCCSTPSSHHEEQQERGASRSSPTMSLRSRRLAIKVACDRQNRTNAR